MHLNPIPDYEGECETGKAAFLELMQNDPSQLKIAFTLQGMIERGKVTGYEVGFLHALSESLR
jgi:hypothetical protein